MCQFKIFFYQRYIFENFILYIFQIIFLRTNFLSLKAELWGFILKSIILWNSCPSWIYVVELLSITHQLEVPAPISVGSRGKVLPCEQQRHSWSIRTICTGTFGFMCINWWFYLQDCFQLLVYPFIKIVSYPFILENKQWIHISRRTDNQVNSINSPEVETPKEEHDLTHSLRLHGNTLCKQMSRRLIDRPHT